MAVLVQMLAHAGAVVVPIHVRRREPLVHGGLPPRGDSK
jgi:hypothetical protein